MRKGYREKWTPSKTETLASGHSPQRYLRSTNKHTPPERESSRKTVGLLQGRSKRIDWKERERIQSNPIKVRVHFLLKEKKQFFRYLQRSSRSSLEGRDFPMFFDELDDLWRPDMVSRLNQNPNYCCVLSLSLYIYIYTAVASIKLFVFPRRRIVLNLIWSLRRIWGGLIGCVKVGPFNLIWPLSRSME